MAETYRLFCDRSSWPYDRAIERKIENIGYGIFGKALITFQCAEHVLARLRSHYKLILATKGDEEIQLAKIDQSGLAHFFTSIQILDHKTEGEFRRIAEECELDVSSSWVVGDSLRSDINPALEVGFRAIWIE
ncbi:MAG: HAD hydrolase-like protein [Pyrinomonadaceae bacterium]